MLIKVKVIPGSKTDSVIKTTAGSFVINVKAKAERGEANRSVKLILAEYFRIPSGKIRLLKGGKKPNKIFEVKREG